MRRHRSLALARTVALLGGSGRASAVDPEVVDTARADTLASADATDSRPTPFSDWTVASLRPESRTPAACAVRHSMVEMRRGGHSIAVADRRRSVRSHQRCVRQAFAVVVAVAGVVASPSALAQDAAASDAHSASATHRTDTGPASATTAVDPPPEPSSGPRTLTLGIQIFDLYDLDLRRGTFAAGFYLWMRHPRVAIESDAHDLERVEFTNGRVEPLDEQERKDVGDETYVVWRVVGAFRFNVDLRNYPFDSQLLEIQIEHPLLETDAARYRDDSASYQRSHVRPERWGLRDTVTIPEYQIRRIERNVVDSIYRTDFGDPSRMQPRSVYSRYVVRILIERRAAPYVYKILIPLLLILGMAYLVFWLPPKEIQTQSALAITALLSCIAFNVTVSGTLPEVGYMTLSDKFFVCEYALLFLNLVQSIYTFNLSENGRMEAAHALDRRCRWGFPILYAGAFAFLILRAVVARA